MSEVLVGGGAIEALLKAYDVDKHLNEAKHDSVHATSVAKRDKAIKKLKYLAGIKKIGTAPHEAFIMRNMPILPPVDRPVVIQGGGRLNYSDINNLYKDLMLSDSKFGQILPDLPPEALVENRKEVYEGLRAVVGLAKPASGASRGKDLKGLMYQVAGDGSPKGGIFHSKLLSKKQDFSGRGTIYAEPRLGFNEMGIPKDSLWTMYKFHIIRELSKQGYSYVDAEKAYADRKDAAVAVFGRVIKTVPIIANRNPTLMRSNISAFYPVPIEGNSIGVNPLHLPLFAGDYDGDALSLFLPMGPNAVHEAKEKLMPSRQIYDARKGFGESLVAPGHEAILGSVHLTEPDMGQAPRHFESEQHVLDALHKGEIEENTPITIGKR